jgi:hypothetical protein
LCAGRLNDNDTHTGVVSYTDDPPSSQAENKFDFSDQFPREKAETMNSFNQTAIANFFTKFLSDNGSEELVELWNSQENIKAFNLIVEKTPKRSSEKKINDPNKPKRGKSAYIFFCSKKREEVKKNLGEGAKATDVTSELGKMWNALKVSTKQADVKLLASHEAEAAKDKARYTGEMDGYVALSEEELAVMVSTKKSRKTSDKDPNAPKRGKSAYIFFCEAMRPHVKEELGEDGKSLIMSELGKRWKLLKEDEDRAAELDRYAKLAVCDKSRYEDEKSNFQSDEQEKKAKKATTKKGKVQPVEPGEESVDDKKVELKKTKKSEDEVEEKKSPKKSPKKKTGYIYFCTHNREEIKANNPKMQAKEITSTLARLWKELTKEEKKEWSDSAANME